MNAKVNYIDVAWVRDACNPQKKPLKNSINVLLVHHLFKGTKLSGQGIYQAKLLCWFYPTGFLFIFSKNTSVIPKNWSFGA